MTLEVTRDVVEAVLRLAAAAHPLEACGLLLGEGKRIGAMRETANVHAAPETHFEIDPQALIDAYRDQRGAGLAVLGYFHSHPLGEAVPSATDQASAARDGKVWAIVAGEDLRFWRDDPAGFAELSYSIAEI